MGGGWEERVSSVREGLKWVIVCVVSREVRYGWERVLSDFSGFSGFSGFF